VALISLLRERRVGGEMGDGEEEEVGR